MFLSTSKHRIFFCGFMLWPDLSVMYVFVLQQSFRYMVIALYNTLHHHYSLFLFIYITFITWKMDNVSHVKDFRFFCSNNISSVTLRIILKLRGGLYLTKSKQIFQVQQLDPFAMKVLGTYLFSTFLTVFSIIIVWTRTCMIVSVSSLSDLIIIVQRFLK